MCSRPSEFLLYVEMFLCAVFLLSPVLGCMTMSENYVDIDGEHCRFVVIEQLVILTCRAIGKAVKWEINQKQVEENVHQENNGTEIVSTLEVNITEEHNNASIVCSVLDSNRRWIHSHAVILKINVGVTPSQSIYHPILTSHPEVTKMMATDSLSVTLTPTPIPTPSELPTGIDGSEENLPLIIGGGIGGVVILITAPIAAVILGVVCSKLKKKKDEC